MTGDKRSIRGGEPCPPAFDFARTVTAVCFLALALAGCTPSVRYTREQPGKQQQPQQPQPPKPQSPQPPATDPNDWDWGWGPDIDIQAQPPAPAPPTPPAAPAPTRKNAKKDSQTLLEKSIASYLGSPYKYGGTSKNGFDCSGFVMTVYQEVYNKPLPRSSVGMWEAGRSIPLSVAKPGDLVFFKGGTYSQINHVGIYMGDNRFAHSSTTRGVVYDNLKAAYYSRRFAGAKRMP